jgi:Na+/proline symporter/signal transduction histidine kinase
MRKWSGSTPRDEFVVSFGGIAILSALVYLCGLFAVAHYGDTSGRKLMQSRARPVIYALTLAVYCTSWTFFGSVGLASANGLDFLPIYIGPIVVIGLFFPLVLRIVRIAKAQNITSVADFVGARYGKSEQVAALVAIICVIGAVPYIALQLKAISTSVATVLDSLNAGRTIALSSSAGDLSFIVAVMLAGFAMAFGTRNIDATEHQDGLVLSIAMESLVKLVAFIAVGVYVTWWMFDGLGDLTGRAAADPVITSVLARMPNASTWVATTLLAACSIILLPRQFHVTVVENRDERDVRTAAWLFPLYLVAINIFVIPLAIAGLLTFPEGTIDRDMTVLALPLESGANTLAVFVMIGGLSAATAMVIVACVALSIMASNHLFMPLMLRVSRMRRRIEAGDPGSLILIIRRLAIVVLLAMGYAYFHYSAEAALAAIGLLSFAAIAQIAPAFFGGLFWRRATARGAMAGLLVGVTLWAYTLLLPSLAIESESVADIVKNGPLGLRALKPTALFGVEWTQLVHGVVWSLSANVLAFIGFSLARLPTPIERLQAAAFVGSEPGVMGQAMRSGARITVSELEGAVGRYLGSEHTKRSFFDFMQSRGAVLKPAEEADVHLLRFAEHLLASAIGASSSRLVLSLLLRRRNLSREAALKLIDDASATLQYNRDLLQHALDFARQGITVFDRDLRLMAWNREFRDLFDMPSGFLHVGLELEELLRYNATRGIYGPGVPAQQVMSRLEVLVNEPAPTRLRLESGIAIEIRSARMPDGGLVTTYTDVTQTVRAEEALEATNETLEQRVRERTEELVRLNGELAKAKVVAEAADQSKTRFLAAASHDILQPLNAARLYATTLLERSREGGVDAAQLINNLDLSLEAVEEILTTLLEISRLDAGNMKAEPSVFPLGDMLGQLRVEFEPLAKEKNLQLFFAPCSRNVRSDKRMLRRLLQNLISNAIKYTPKGRVLVGVRHRGESLVVEVWDTGLGIPQDKQKIVFREFERLAPAAKTARGLGLGLSIVERLSRVLRHRVSLSSEPGRGTVFRVEVPRAAAVAVDSGFEDAHVSAAQHLPLSGMVVLAIDNEERILDGMRGLLSGWGCNVVTADSIEAAERELSARNLAPQAIVADYHLDNGDGIEAIIHLRRVFGLETPSVLVTADRTPEVRALAEANDIRVLNKPLRPAALRSLLSQWLVTQRAAE